MGLELTKECPWRPADWRWQRAGLLAAGDLKRNRRFDDSHVQKLEQFARTVLNDTSDDAQERLYNRNPAMFWAYRLYMQDEVARRSEVEARIIANQTPNEIMLRTGIDEKTIEAYEIAFYDVRDKLQYPSYVLHTLIGTALHRGLQERDYALVWKYMAHTFGPYVFDAYLNQSVQPGKPRDATGVKACLIDAGFVAVLRKQLLAGTSIPLNPFTQAQVLDIYAKFVEIERQNGQAAGGGSAMMTKNIEAVLSLIPLDIGPYSKPTVDGPALSRYDSSSEELPLPRLLLAARGDIDDDEPQHLQYPEPANYARITERSGTGDDSGS